MSEPLSGEVVDPRAQAAAIVKRAFSGRVVEYVGTRNPDEWLSQAGRDLVLEGQPKSTRDTYRARYWPWVRWCAETKRQHLPATEESVIEFIESCWRRIGRYGRPWAPRTVRLTLDVISVAHREALRPERDQSGRALRGWVSPTKAKAVHDALRGYKRRWEAAGHRPDKAYAPSQDEVEALVETCDVRSPTGLLHALVLSMTYDAGFRRGELVARNWPDVEVHVRDETNVDTEDHLVIHIAFSKTDQAGDGDAVVLYAHPDHSATTCPVRLFLAWRRLLVERGLPLEGALLRTVLSPGSPPKDGSPRKGKVTTGRLPAEALETILRLAAQRSGLNVTRPGERPRHIAPHGLRAAAITAASEDDTVSPAAIFEHFRFSKDSPVALRYMRYGRKKSQNPMRRAWVRRGVKGQS